jgi:cell division protein FtsW
MVGMSPNLRRPVDRLLLLFALLLVAIGMVWIYSASGVKGGLGSGAATAFLTRQLVGGVIGVGIMLVVTQVELSSLQENPKPLYVAYGGLLVALMLTLLIGPKINGAHRWIRVGSFNFQASEFMKPIAVLIAARWMVKHQESWRQSQDALPKLVMLLLLMVPALALILVEPDFGTTVLITLSVFFVIFLGGLPRGLLAGLALSMGSAGVLAIVSSAYRLARFKSLFHSDPQGDGYQAAQSLVAIGSGGLTGVGIGASQQKLFYLPEAHTDFIYAIIGEELGMIGTVTVLVLFIGILWRGFRIARRVNDGFLKLCAMGLTLLIVVQAMMNLSVVLSLAPNKGIPLPFISYGPNSLIASLICLGLLLSISKDANVN